ncbi:NAD-dependent epimerase/dehydratase family protein [Tetragenococcus halophilus]|uniref:NAD-dependent epimerase/dehydratase family protein n=1 Tax=Tetragenococcus halophilus TaxID=51669 RepID=UPI00209ADF3F|nr:NAD-dependent epimerase/dehydratase family protein [Tetragenococcus halophilus]MCO8287178.1 NAD-dependent epimerase/dehydratase family protein [Tetragenococcus halophilus]
MNYLVTGGAGFIGSNLVNRLVTEGNHITIIDDLSMGKKCNIRETDKVKFFEGSVMDKNLLSSIIKAESFDYIFHLAAVASVADSIERPLETHKVNYDSVLYLLNLCKKYQPGLKRFIFSSSSAVYGDIDLPFKSETTPVKPLSQYAVDKYAGERTVLNFYNLYGVPTSAVRFFNVYGPNQNPSSPYSGVVSILTDKFQKLREGEKTYFTLFGDGKQTRDFIFVDDVLNALNSIAISSKSLGEVYNVGTGTGTSLNQIIKILSGIYSIELPIVQRSVRKGDIRQSVASKEKLTSLGFDATYTVNEGLNKLVRSFHERK